MKNLSEKQISEIRKDILMFVSWKLSNNIADAEDITQDALIKVYTSLQSYDDSKSFRNWYLTIARNCLVDFFRSMKVRITEVSVSDFVNENGNEIIQIVDNNNPEEKISDAEMMKSIKKEIRNLKDEYRKVIMLRYFQKMEYKEIAEYCDMPMSNVMSAIHRAKKILQEKFNGKIAIA